MFIVDVDAKLEDQSRYSSPDPCYALCKLATNSFRCKADAIMQSSWVVLLQQYRAEGRSQTCSRFCKLHACGRVFDDVPTFAHSRTPTGVVRYMQLVVSEPGRQVDTTRKSRMWRTRVATVNDSPPDRGSCSSSSRLRQWALLSMLTGRNGTEARQFVDG